MTAGWGARTSRAAVFAAVCVLLAALGHVLMSGTPVRWWTVAAGFAGTAALGWCLAGRERGLPTVVSVAVLAQTALHTAFSLARSGAGTGVRSGAAAHDLGPPDAMAAGGGPGGAGAGTGAGVMDIDPALHAQHLGHFAHDMSGGGSPSLGMLAAHALAALLSGLWLGHGERAAFQLLRAVGNRLAAPLRLPVSPLAPPPARPSPRPLRERAARMPRPVRAHTIISRGPPAATAVV